MRLALVCCVLIAVETTLAQPNGVTFLGNINIPHGFSPQGTRFSSCWGWVAPDGREYALLGCYTGTSIIDLNGPTLEEIQFIPGPPAAYAYREIKTYKQYAYIVSEGGEGVQIVDLSGLPDTAILVKSFVYYGLSGPDSGKSIIRNHTVTLANGFLYCNGSATWLPGGSVIFDLHNDPTTPQFVGTYEPMYLHDTYVRNDTLYGAAIYSSGGLFIADVTDKSTPSTLVHISYAGSGTHNAWASINGRYAYTTDEIGTPPHNLKVWDIGSLPSYAQVGSYAASPVENIHNVHGRGNYLYIAHYTAGMRVADVHAPDNPIEAGFYDSAPTESSAVYSGCWGVYPYFPSGRWIGSDMHNGLCLCTFSGLAPRVRSALIEPSDSVSIDSAFTFRWTKAANQSEDPLYYDVRLKGPGLDTLFTTRDTSVAYEPLGFLQYGGLYSWFVTIHDEYSEVVSADTFTFHYDALPYFTRGYSVSERWNLVSVPLLVPDSLMLSLYPSAVSSAFRYSAGSYVQKDTLVPGDGYWLKFDSAQSVTLSGFAIFVDTIDLSPGWNIVGSISDSVWIDSIETIPSGILNSYFFGFDNGYKLTFDAIVPGEGYFVSASSQGRMILRSKRLFIPPQKNSSPLRWLEACGSIEFREAIGGTQKLYYSSVVDDLSQIERISMPPLPPSGIFDVRFSTNRVVEVVKSSREIPIRVASATYPLIVKWNKSSQSVIAALMIDGKEEQFPPGKILRLESSASSISLKLWEEVPIEFRLEQNYPNPFNPSTEIRFQISDFSQVSLKVFDLLGREVATLMNERKGPGTYDVEWNASKLASGIYFYQIVVGGFKETKKMLVLQ